MAINIINNGPIGNIKIFKDPYKDIFFPNELLYKIEKISNNIFQISFLSSTNNNSKVIFKKNFIGDLLIVGGGDGGSGSYYNNGSGEAGGGTGGNGGKIFLKRNIYFGPNTNFYQSDIIIGEGGQAGKEGKNSKIFSYNSENKIFQANGGKGKSVSWGSTWASNEPGSSGQSGLLFYNTYYGGGGGGGGCPSMVAGGTWSQNPTTGYDGGAGGGGHGCFDGIINTGGGGGGRSSGWDFEGPGKGGSGIIVLIIHI